MGSPAARIYTFQCRRCGGDFFKKESYLTAYRKQHQRDPLYCSRECAGISIRLSLPPEFICGHCGKTASRKRVDERGRSRGFQYNARYCSRACAADAKRSGYVTGEGYRAFKNGGGKRILEHRQVMEQRLGRPLLRYENVHHKDGNRLNNDPANLELWNTSQPCGQRVEDKIEFCRSLLAEYGQLPGMLSIADTALGYLSIGG
jgi:hypothetical protein